MLPVPCSHTPRIAFQSSQFHGSCKYKCYRWGSTFHRSGTETGQCRGQQPALHIRDGLAAWLSKWKADSRHPAWAGETGERRVALLVILARSRKQATKVQPRDISAFHFATSFSASTGLSVRHKACWRWLDHNPSNPKTCLVYSTCQ